MQGDQYDANAADLVSVLLNLNGNPAGQNSAALDLLKNWDYQAGSDSAAAAVFESFWRHLLQNTFNDDLPKDYRPDGGSRWVEVMHNLIARPSDPFWDDTSTKEGVETEDDIMNRSLTDAVKELDGMFGSDTTKWKWGVMHAATFRNQTLGESGIGLIEDLFNRGPYPVGGGEAIIDATGWSIVDGYETNWLPSMRMIVDMSDLTHSVTVHTTGESGHAYDAHYADMSPLWADIRYYPMLWGQGPVEAQAEGHLKLLP
jgi:penicillin amidase